MGHTPGPWTVGEHRGVWVGPVVHADGKGVAFVVGSDVDGAEANARLIAAAPELLGFLHQIADECKRKLRKGKDSAFCDRMILELCRAAIAKAEGRSE